MKNVNDQVKMKVLEHLRKHMDERLAGRLKPKKEVSVEQVSAEPMEHESKLPLPLDPSHEQPKEHGLDDDDAHRLMQLYSSLK